MELWMLPHFSHLVGYANVTGKSEGNSSFYWVSEIISLSSLVAESEAEFASSIWLFLVKFRFHALFSPSNMSRCISIFLNRRYLFTNCTDIEYTWNYFSGY